MSEVITERLGDGAIVLFNTGSRVKDGSRPYIVGCYFAPGVSDKESAVGKMMNYFYVKYGGCGLGEAIINEPGSKFFEGVFDCMAYPPSDLESILGMEMVVEGGRLTGGRSKCPRTLLDEAVAEKPIKQKRNS